ncbi:MAG: M13 family metallopeptidase [Alphaproteobacteria bacterium]|nr:M13 family metallopeptidase [Alphaproteobacteria bacterium]
MTTGIDIKNMDLSVRPGDDFYNFAGGGWRAANPLTGEYSRYGVFDKLGQENLEKLHKIVKNAGDKKIATLYNQAMDAKKLNADGIAPVIPHLQKIDALESREEFFAALANSHKFGGAFWGDGVEEDIMDSEHYIYSMGQGGIGLPEREYYFDDDEKSKDIRKKYKKYMSDVFEMFEIKSDVAAVYEIEEKLARAHFKKEKLRDPHANYHKMTRDQFAEKYAGFDWENYFEIRAVEPKNIDVSQPEAFAAALEIIKTAPLENLRAYMKWKIANGAMTALGDAQYELQFDFYGKTLSGKTERRPRWKDAVATADSVLGEAVGQEYVKKYFPPQAKAKMLNLVDNLRRAYGARIENLEWMSPETKKRALEKLSAFRVKIGYPDRWRDYSKLEISEQVSLYENLRAAQTFEDAFWMEKADGPVDKDYWYMNPQTVNAYYNPPTNEICFPAGILQPPFFDMSAPDAFNYGAIGSIIGHEMTHGFDDKGRQFDWQGNLKDWWTAKDATAFEKRAKVMKEFFDKIEVAPGLYANGEFSLGETLADYGGIVIAFDAWKLANPNETVAGQFTAEQIFVIAHAFTFVDNIRSEEVVRRTKTGVHPLGEWRVNGILPHIDAWYEAFDITPADKLYVAPEDRVKVW